MKSKISSFIQKNQFVSAVSVLVLMLLLPVPSLGLEILICLEFVSVIGISIYSYTKHKNAMPKLVLYYCLFSLGLNISLTKFSLLGFRDDKQVPFIQLLGNYISGTNPIIGFIIALLLLYVIVMVISKGNTRVEEIASRQTTYHKSILQ